MKIERGNMRITEVPHVYCIDVSNIDCEIKFTDFVNPITFTKEQLQEFHAALTEAVKYSGASIPTAVRFAAEPREWKEGDPEPTDVTAVIDDDGDRWEKGPGGWKWNGNTRPWQRLLSNHGPVEEAK